ncbi:unnamed protein product [Urochloa humidicola]
MAATSLLEVTHLLSSPLLCLRPCSLLLLARCDLRLLQSSSGPRASRLILRTSIPPHARGRPSMIQGKRLTLLLPLSLAPAPLTLESVAAGGARPSDPSSPEL